MKVAFRADASMAIGSGHVMRCLTLADELRRRGAETLFLCRHLPETLETEIARKGHGLVRLPHAGPDIGRNPDTYLSWLEVSQERDAADTLDRLVHCDWLVVDHYALDAAWETRLRAGAGHILALDDLANRPHDCDVLLDQNLQPAGGQRYAGLAPAHCEHLLGLRYALLRPEFQALRTTPRQGPARRLLVFFGGMDAGNMTGRALASLDALPAAGALEIDVVIGASHPQREGIRAWCQTHPNARCHVQTPDMAQLMASADLALCAGGGSVWERCALGLPTVTLCLADNQASQLREAAHAGLLIAPDFDLAPEEAIATHLKSLLENQALRSLLSRNGMAAVDGLGTRRVADRLMHAELSVRRAGIADSDNLFRWRNSPEIRCVSRNPAPIARDGHDRWLDSVLADPARPLLIGEHGAESIGVVRFDLQESTAEVSIYLVPGLGGQGWGKALLLAAETWLRHNHPQVVRIEAEVLNDNQPSHRLFSQCGYRLETTRYSKRTAS